jgi:hypothetical protein
MFWTKVSARLDLVIRLLAKIAKGQEIMSAQLDALANQISQTDSVVDSAITLINGFGAQLDQLKKQLADQGSDTSALVALRADLAAKTAKLASAVAENTVAAPAPSPAPAPAPSPDPVSTPADPGAGSTSTAS